MAGLNYNMDEIYAPFAKLQSLRILLALAAIYDWEIDQMDVVTAFLNPEIDDDVYMQMPDGHPKTGEVCKLRKSLDGLKQAPALWYKHIDEFLPTLRLKRSQYDPNVYISKTGSRQVILLLYVDDILIFSPSRDKVNALKRLLHEKYRMTDLGPIKKFLGLVIERDRSRRRILVQQKPYFDAVLKKHGLSSCNGQWTPQPTGEQLR